MSNMPTLELSLDDELLGTVSTETLSVLRVDVFGNCGDEGLARLWVDGRREVGPDVTEGISFVSGLELQPGQCLGVKLFETGSSQAFPDMSQLRGGGFCKAAGEPYHLVFGTSRRVVQHISTDENESGFSFSLVWVSSEPSCAHIKLSTNARDSSNMIRTRRQHVAEHIQVGQSAYLRIDT